MIFASQFNELIQPATESKNMAMATPQTWLGSSELVWSESIKSQQPGAGSQEPRATATLTLI
ncbi:GL25262 [Drosophila persimilis]|uniref:GL25262 n=1 Tax=Drosophila persimilis TaxID=7234 RepID=B4GRT3_DROPE|nr:GL25262 [Drosophila persimilis]